LYYYPLNISHNMINFVVWLVNTKQNILAPTRSTTIKIVLYKKIFPSMKRFRRQFLR